MPLSIISHNGHRKAVVAEDAEGVFVDYYRTTGCDDWRFHHRARPALPFHAALDLADRLINAAPPAVGEGAR